LFFEKETSLPQDFEEVEEVVVAALRRPTLREVSDETLWHRVQSCFNIVNMSSKIKEGFYIVRITLISYG